MPSIFNNIWPTQVAFNMHSNAPFSAPPSNQPAPHYQFPATGGYLPGAAIPSAPSHSLKNTISKLPSLFNINHAANS